MAVETLQAAQLEAANLLGHPEYYGLYQEGRERRLYEAVVHVDEGVGDVTVMRAHSGPRTAEITADTGERVVVNTIGKGGTRFYPYPTLEIARAKVTELADEMYGKGGVQNLTEYVGAKGLAVVDARQMTHKQLVAMARAFHGFMDDQGLAGHKFDIPAGDAGTNGLSDIYALEHREQHPNDPFWQAVVTGKSERYGGRKDRPQATGGGMYESQITVMDDLGQDEVSATIQGFGNVGAWYACTAYEQRDPDTGKQRVRIEAISDVDGILSTNHPDGIQVTREMVETIIDDPRFLEKNPQYNGDKLQALADWVERSQPGIELTRTYDANDILTYPTEYFVPASPIMNVITGDNVARLGATVGVNEGTNGAFAPLGHAGAVQRGLTVIPDILANSLGVERSVAEHKDNIVAAGGRVLRAANMSMTEAARNATLRTLEAAKHANTRDLRVAAAIISMCARLDSQGMDIDLSLLQRAA